MEVVTAWLIFSWKTYYCIDLIATTITIWVMNITSRGKPSDMPFAFALNCVGSVLWFYAAWVAIMPGGLVLNVWGFYRSIVGMIKWREIKNLQSVSI